MKDGTPFAKEDDDMANKIIKYLKKNFKEDNLRKEIKFYYEHSRTENMDDVIKYIYTIRPKTREEIDPYNEEDWGNEPYADAVIVASQTRGGNVYKEPKDQKLSINGVDFIISKYKFKQIWDIFTNPENIKKEKERKYKIAKEKENLIKQKEENRREEQLRKDQLIKHREKKNEIRKKIEF